MENLDSILIDTLVFFSFLSSLCVMSCFDIKRYAYRNVMSGGGLKLAIYRLREFLSSPASAKSLGVAGAALCCATLLHFLDMDKSVLWYNTNYLTIKTAEDVGLSNEFTIVYHQAFRIVGLLSGMLGVILIFNGRIALGFLFFFLWFYAVLLLYIGNSRWLIIYFSSVAIAVRIFGRGALSRTGFYLLILCALISFIQVIFGRGGDHFGFSVLSNQFFSFSLSDVPFALRGILINTFEGALNVANSILISPSFSQRYQIGSVSPLLSTIDGFDTFRDSDKAKFAPHVPMGAFGEVLHFSLPIQILYFLVLFLAMRATVRWEFSLPVAYYLPLAVFYIYVFYLLPTYSARTTSRFIFLAFFIYFVWPYIKHVLAKASRRA
ncbi:hypothetical protein [Rhodobacter sp. 24-YEA-8]|uniref:hypothetical protein n=1 Tax=Rhodobacter sp. 24-YEA-8 TaxID=1884310 RepID=UPI00115FEE3B|nr:hypothetical protein [Rhodobacter sp. 24-YEA-8]